MNALISHVTKKFTKPQLPDVMTGDVVRVSQKIEEGGKTRTQVFEGIVIERSGGKGIHAAITVRKISNGVGIEKKYLLNSPTIEKVEVLRSSKVRRKKIFFLRNLTGKAARLKERKRELVEAIETGEPVENADNTQDLAPAAEEVVEESAETETPAQEVVASEQTAEPVQTEQPTEAPAAEVAPEAPGEESAEAETTPAQEEAVPAPEAEEAPAAEPATEQPAEEGAPVAPAEATEEENKA